VYIIRNGLPAPGFNEEAKFTEQRNSKEDETHDSHRYHVTSRQLPLKRWLHAIIHAFYTHTHSQYAKCCSVTNSRNWMCLLYNCESSTFIAI